MAAIEFCQSGFGGFGPDEGFGAGTRCDKLTCHWGCSCLRMSAIRGVPPLTLLTQISILHRRPTLTLTLTLGACYNRDCAARP
jgi:hypothetical protein